MKINSKLVSVSMFALSLVCSSAFAQGKTQVPLPVVIIDPMPLWYSGIVGDEYRYSYNLAGAKHSGDYHMANHFSVEIDGVSQIGMQSVSGYDLVTYKDGEDGTMHTRPGNHKAGKMTVTKDWSNTSEWYKWRKAVLDGKVDRRSISVIFHNDSGEEVGRINLYHAWPSVYRGPQLNSRSSGHATEKLEVSYETFELKTK